jgi:hypothetical protein
VGRAITIGRATTIGHATTIGRATTIGVWAVKVRHVETKTAHPRSGGGRSTGARSAQ